jgi:tRNA dimethylallyltransferase
MAPDGRHRESSPPAHPAEPSTLACPAGDAARPAAPRLAGDCWILSGPTAAGKTALALDLARRLDAEIVSVDSMAVYQGLDIGTAKPSPSERARVEHHVIDVVPPSEPYSVARWLADAAAAVETIRSRGRQILFVGGTPLYLRALRDGLAPLPADDPVFRRGLLEEIEVHGSAALHSRLATIDPAAAARIHPNDVKRIVRALEVSHATGRPLSDAFAPVPDPIFESRMMIVDLPRRLLLDRIDRRVDAMFAAGLVDEVRRADASGGLGPTARQAAGYAECLDLLAGRVPLAEAVRLTKQRTRQLAKRQLTWLRSFKGAVWITA